MRPVLRLLVACAGYLCAILAAGSFLLLALYGVLATPEIKAGVEEVVGTTGILLPSYLVAGLGMSLAASATFAPAAIFILVTEFFGLRSIYLHAGFGGALGAAGSLLVSVPNPGLDPSMATTMLVATGFVGGLAYWLVAGRTAGLWPDERASETQ